MHGTPTSNVDYLFPNSPDAKFKAIAMDAQADVIIYGHTHQTTCLRRRGVWFLNPGSLIGKRGFAGTCAILELPEFDFRVINLDTVSLLPFN